jgi:DNA-binding Xre family transcriptional regulator
MLKLKLKDAMTLYASRHGQRVTYDWLAERTGLSRATIESLASRPSYDTRLSTIDKLCNALNCQLDEILEFTLDVEGNSASGQDWNR